MSSGNWTPDILCSTLMLTWLSNLERVNGGHFCWCTNWRLEFDDLAEINRAWLYKDRKKSQSDKQCQVSSVRKAWECNKKRSRSPRVPGSISTEGNYFCWMCARTSGHFVYMYWTTLNEIYFMHFGVGFVTKGVQNISPEIM